MDKITDFWYVNILDKKPNMNLDELGGKGYNLAKIASIDSSIKVPSAFVIPTSICRAYKQYPDEVMQKIRDEVVPEIMKQFIETFGYMPLVSVRSGAKVSMPGMMDTILNVGLDGETLAFWEEKLGIECIKDSRDRLVEMFGSVVHGIDRKLFDGLKGAERASLYAKKTGGGFPQALQQIIDSIEAVFKSWDNERAVIYRDLHDIPHDMGTAVVIQAMVFGNFNEKSCTGVMFTRSPSDGANELRGEYLVNAQGEDVVAGIRTPEDITNLPQWNLTISEKLLKVASILEQHYKDMQDIEFTVQDNELYILQTRNGKRTAEAALKIATDFYLEQDIDSDTLFNRVSLTQVLTCMRPKIDPNFKQPATLVGIPASNGIVSGVAMLSSPDAINCSEPCILVANETTPDDIGGMHASLGILTRTGGATSHAAVVARGMDKVCVVGCTNLPYIIQGTKITINGNTGEVWIGIEVPVIENTDTLYQDLLIDAAIKKYNIFKIVTTIEDVTEEECLVPLFALNTTNKLETLNKIIAKMKQGVIDIRPHINFMEESDVILTGMFGQYLNKPPSAEVDNIIKFLNTFDATDKDISIIGAVVGLKEESGFKEIKSLGTLEGSIEATGKWMWASDCLDTVPKVLLDKVVAMKKAVGDDFNIVQIQKGFRPEEKNLEIFTKNKMTYMHPKVLLQSVLNK